jgi:hypothetical protein
MGLKIMQTLTPLKAIRAKCRDCSNNQPEEIKKCPIQDCPLFLYRFGNNPKRKGIGNRNANVVKNKAENKNNTNSLKDL